MSKTAVVVLSLAVVCAAFALGVGVGRARKPETRLQQRAANTHEPRPQTNGGAILLSRLEGFRNTLSEKEKTIALLEAELDQVRAKLPPPLTPEEEKQKKKRDESRKLHERWKELAEKSRPLREKILQRKDKAFRAWGLDELAALLESEDTEELLVGLTTLPHLGSINCDKERFRGQVLAALGHEDPEAREAALHCLHIASSGEKALDLLLSMANDPSAHVRRWVAEQIAHHYLYDVDHKERQITAALEGFLQDEDWQIKRCALDGLAGSGHAAEMEGLALELSEDPEYAKATMYWLGQKEPISAKAAKRLVDMFEEDDEAGIDSVDWMLRRRLS